MNIIESGAMLLLDGPVGPMEVLFDLPAQARARHRRGRASAAAARRQCAAQGAALPRARACATPAGSSRARTSAASGAAQGTHDHGVRRDGRLLCAVAVAACRRTRICRLRWSASRSAPSCSRAWRRALADRGAPAWTRRVSPACHSARSKAGRRYDTPDGICPTRWSSTARTTNACRLQAVLDWARPQSQPIVVVPGADHFFTGRLPVLRNLVTSHLTI